MTTFAELSSEFPHSVSMQIVPWGLSLQARIP